MEGEGTGVVLTVFNDGATWLRLQSKHRQCPSNIVTPATQVSEESLLFLYKEETCT